MQRSPSSFFLFFFWWISAFFSASLWWRQGSFKPGSAHGRLLSQRCPLSTVLACWRKRGWGSSLADPVIPRKAYMSTHAGFLISLYVAEVSVMGSSSNLREQRRDVDARVWPPFRSEGRKVKTSFVFFVFCFVFLCRRLQQGVFGFAGLMAQCSWLTFTVLIVSADVPVFAIIGHLRMTAQFKLTPVLLEVQPRALD